MLKKYKFTTVILEGRQGGAGIKIPFSIEEEFGTKAQVKVKV